MTKLAKKVVVLRTHYANIHTSASNTAIKKKKETTTMKKVIIPQAQSNTVNATSLRSDKWDRELIYRNGCKYCVVTSAYYGNMQSYHKTEQAAIRQAKRWSNYETVRIIDDNGDMYEVDTFGGTMSFVNNVSVLNF